MRALQVISYPLCNLSANAELDGGYELTTLERGSTPNRTTLALAIGGETDKILVNDSIPYASPIPNRSLSYK